MEAAMHSGWMDAMWRSSPGLVENISETIHNSLKTLQNQNVDRNS